MIVHCHHGRSAYTFSEADVISTSLPISASAGRGTADGSTGGVGAMGGGAKGNGWVAGTAGRMLGVLFSGGSIPAARSEASRELSPPPPAGVGFGGG